MLSVLFTYPCSSIMQQKIPIMKLAKHVCHIHHSVAPGEMEQGTSWLSFCLFMFFCGSATHWLHSARHDYTIRQFQSHSAEELKLKLAHAPMHLAFLWASCKNDCAFPWRTSFFIPHPEGTHFSRNTSGTVVWVVLQTVVYPSLPRHLSWLRCVTHFWSSQLLQRRII